MNLAEELLPFPLTANVGCSEAKSHHQCLTRNPGFPAFSRFAMSAVQNTQERLRTRRGNMQPWRKVSRAFEASYSVDRTETVRVCDGKREIEKRRQGPTQMLGPIHFEIHAAHEQLQLKFRLDIFG